MRFLRYLDKCFDKCQAESHQFWRDCKNWQSDSNNLGKPYPLAYDQQVVEERKDAIDYIYAFMGSAIDRQYPFLEGGFKNNLPDEMKKCYEVFWFEYLDHGYLWGLQSAARYLNVSFEEVRKKLDRIDAVMESLAHKEVKAIMRLDNDRDIKQVLHFFKMNVERDKDMILNLQ